MAARYRLHGACEVAGLAEEGFPNSWWAATVEAINSNHTVKVKYRDMLENDDDPTKYVVETVPKERVRPAPPDDSHTVPISERQCGEAVDCWTKDGWWTGHVHELFDDRITVFFPATPEEEPVEVRDAPPGGYSESDNRVRTSKKWLHGASAWGSEPPRVFDGCRNHRTHQAPQHANAAHAAGPAPRAIAAQPGPSHPPSAEGGKHAGDKRKQSAQLQDDELMPAPKRKLQAPAKDPAAGQAKAKPVLSKQRPAATLAAQPAGSVRHAKEEKEVSRKSAAVPRSGPPQSSQRQVTASLKQPASAPAAAAGSRPPPRPAPSSKPSTPRPGGLGSHAKSAAAAAAPSQRDGSRAAPSQSKPAASKPSGSRPQPAGQSAPPQHRQQQDQHQQRAGDPWALPPQQGTKQPWPDPQHGKGQQVHGKGAGPAAGAAPKQHQQQRPALAAASQRPHQGSGATARPAPAAAKESAHPSGRAGAARPRPSGRAAVKQAAETLRRHRRDAEEYREKAADAAHKRSAPAKARDTFIIPKIVVQDRGPADLDISGGHLVCLDNIGGFTDRDALREILNAKLPNLRQIRFADIQLDAKAGDAGIVRGGWACLEFRGARDAALAYPQLQRLYLVGASPGPPRPLLAHWPRWQDTPWGDGPKPEMLGFLRLPHPASAHFVQPNSIEFEMALRWRLVTERLGYAKRQIQARQQTELTAVLASYRKAKKLPEPGAAAGTQAEPGSRKAVTRSRSHKLSKSYIWLKGIAADTDLSMVRTAFEQFTDDPKVEAPQSVVSERPFGHLLITLKEPKKAEYVMNDLRENIFVMHGTPRPVDASVARPGAPLGSQRLYDAALEDVFGTDAAGYPADPSSGAAAGDSNPACEGKGTGNKAGSKLALIEIAEPAAGKQPATVDEAAALKLRKLLARYEVERAELWRQGLDLKRELHKEQLKSYDVEKQKFSTIKELNGAPIVRQLNGGRGNPYPNLRMS